MKKYTVTVPEGEDINYSTRIDANKNRIGVSVEGGEAMQVSDGYHTMDELYDHRISIFIALCKALSPANRDEDYPALVWRSKRHSDGEICFGTGTQFVLGIEQEAGKQITYHIPVERWDETDFAETLEKAPEWDGHTSDDVLARLKNI